jgi:predicted NBD/HSP70 family sugar kinase
MRTRSYIPVSTEALLGHICRRISASPPEIAEPLQVGFSRIRRPLEELEASKLIRWDKSANTCSLNPDFGTLVGIDMGASHLHFALTDFTGRILADTNCKIRPEAGPRRLMSQIKREIQRLTRQPRGRRLRGLGIGVPSPIDPPTGLALLANNLPGWVNVDLRSELEQAFHIPVAIENDANMAAIGEHWRGVAQRADHFVFIALGTGIGSGIFVNGQLYRGRTGAAGELGRLHLEWQRWHEDFGDKGYFETYASGQGIAAMGRTLMGRATEHGNLAEERDALFVFDAFRRGNPPARQALETIFTILAAGIANVVAILDPELVVLGGGVTKGAPEFMLSTIENVARRIQPNLPPVRLSALDERAQTFGAVFSAMTVACHAALRQKHS